MSLARIAHAARTSEAASVQDAGPPDVRSGSPRLGDPSVFAPLDPALSGRRLALACPARYSRRLLQPSTRMQGQPVLRTASAGGPPASLSLDLATPGCRWRSSSRGPDFGWWATTS